MSKVDELVKQHRELSHAMQSGVEFSKDKSDQESKHLRVGINVALADGGSLARLLIHKGVITEEEYLQAIVDGMKREVESYRDSIYGETGTKPYLA